MRAEQRTEDAFGFGSKARKYDQLEKPNLPKPYYYTK
jgi:hypothetical protein